MTPEQRAWEKPDPGDVGQHWARILKCIVSTGPTFVALQSWPPALSNGITDSHVENAQIIKVCRIHPSPNVIEINFMKDGDVLAVAVRIAMNRAADQKWYGMHRAYGVDRTLSVLARDPVGSSWSPSDVRRQFYHEHRREFEWDQPRYWQSTAYMEEED